MTTYNLEELNVTFAKAKQIEDMNDEETRQYLRALQSLIDEAKTEIEYVEAFGNKEE